MHTNFAGLVHWQVLVLKPMASSVSYVELYQFSWNPVVGELYTTLKFALKIFHFQVKQSVFYYPGPSIERLHVMS